MTKAHQYVFASGGGVQSTACMVLSAQGRIPYRAHIFANVGDNAEDPRTIAYVREVLQPFAEAHGIEWVETRRRRRDGTPVDLYDDLHRPIRAINIPVRMKNGAPGRRSCTTDWKIAPIAKWIKANAPGCILGKGISTDEHHRATPTRESDGYTSAYPLIELGISRADCLRLVADAGLPQPPKSSCWFCPFKTGYGWQALRAERPELFRKAADLERLLNEKRDSLGKDRVYLSNVGARRGLSIDQAFADQPTLFPEWIDEQDGCESGHCMT